jgi:hypothetical protein
MVRGQYFLPKKLGKIIGSNRLNLPNLGGRYEKILGNSVFLPLPCMRYGGSVE